MESSRRCCDHTIKGRVDLYTSSLGAQQSGQVVMTRDLKPLVVSRLLLTVLLLSAPPHRGKTQVSKIASHSS